MKKSLLGLAIGCLAMSMYSCDKQHPTVNTATPAQSVSQLTGHQAMRIADSISTGGHISISQANVQIGSYLRSVGYSATNDTATRTITGNVALFRELTADPRVKHISLMIAHSGDWATNHFGQPAGTSHITLIMVSMDADGHFIAALPVDDTFCQCPSGYCCTIDMTTSSGLLPE